MNTEALRELLYTAFNDEELSTFCYDHFKEVYKDFTTGQTQTVRAQKLIEYCDRKGNLGKLLNLVKERNPSKYTEFAPKLIRSSVLDERLEETLKLYLSKSYKDDQYARLDQAGETDPDRSTLLRQIFVDLEVKPRSGQQPRRTRQKQATLFEDPKRALLLHGEDQALSAMDCFLQEQWPRIVIIGGPGQGKSTLGQYLAQVHRSVFLGHTDELSQHSHGSSKTKKKEFTPKILRTPFRIILKYFAQWLADGQKLDSVEAYLAELLKKATSREISPENVQDILHVRPSLVIFDGLDEVIDPDLRSRMLPQVEAFLARMEQLDANLQVLATSRPTGYSDQFNPTHFWHLELQPMSQQKVHEYAQKWVDAKVPVQEEKRRVLDTLKECQREEHTRLLLTTPLQVTIILLIIKDGGRPPAQREALFHEYWATIFRREKAKAKGVIRTEEQLLFDLHAYLGYLLHRLAASENVRSLFPAVEFEQAVHSFLRAKDSHSPEESIKQRAAQIVEEATGRLVLLVDPEPGLFGFELRSLQEFFAAAYLAQTARDTIQRFERLKAIARSEHWRNVALFFAGRIVRNFSGEAANILALVCRPIDRDPADRYLRRGAWLALDIAADGAFAANRDLQYEALEYGLTVLETGIAKESDRHLKTALRRLSREDRRDILGPLLTQKLGSLPLSCLVVGLDAYGRFLKEQGILKLQIVTLLSSSQPHNIKAALDLGFRHRVEPPWLAAPLEQHWSVWVEKDGGNTLWYWWEAEPSHTETVLSAWAPSEARARHLLNQLVELRHWGPPQRSVPSDWHWQHEPESPAEQLVEALRCRSLLNELTELTVFRSLESTVYIGVNGAETVEFVNLTKQHQAQRSVALRDKLKPRLEQLLVRPNLLSPLKAILWSLYWLTNEPTEAQVSLFLEEIEGWSKGTKPVKNTFWLRWIRMTWPLLALAGDCQNRGDQETVKRLRPYLSKAGEISINEQVRIALWDLAQRASSKEWTDFILDLRFGQIKSPPELVPLAEKLGIAVGDLVQTYFAYSHRDNESYSSDAVQRILSAIENNLNRGQNGLRKFRVPIDAPWLMDQANIVHGKRVFQLLMEKLSQQPDTISAALLLFFKLLAADETMLALAPQLLTILGRLEITEHDLGPWFFAQCAVDVPLGRLSKLAEFTSHKDLQIQQGALTLWETLVNAILYGPLYRPHMDDTRWHEFKSIRFDWQQCLSLIGNSDGTIRKRGITLLTLSDFPVADTAWHTELLTLIAKAQEPEELGAWGQLLREIPIPKSEETAWKEFLESILAHPQTYSSTVLAAAMERYTALIGPAGPYLIGDESALGLPAVGR